MFAVDRLLRRNMRERPNMLRRAEILKYARPEGIGAEIGVFKGRFSEVLASRLRPRKLFLVDPWWKVFGDRYPDWGKFTDYGRLETKAAYDAAVRSVHQYRESCNIEFVVERSQEFLRFYDGRPFDWVYLDSSHAYDETCEELSLIAAKLAPNGVIMGDDLAARSESRSSWGIQGSS